MKILDYLLTEEELLELKMKPSFLQKRASKLPILIGIEYELILPFVLKDSYAEIPDSNTLSIDNIYKFFTANNANPKSQIDNILQELKEEYVESYNIEIEDDLEKEWEQDKTFLISQYFKKNIWPKKQSSEVSFEEALKTYSSNETVVEKLRLRYIEKSKKEYFIDIDTVEDDYFYYFIESFFPTLRMFQQTYNLNWPNPVAYEGPGWTMKKLSENFSEFVSKPSSIEPGDSSDEYKFKLDLSLVPDSLSDHWGIEIVSYPMPLNEMQEDLAKVIEWIKSLNGYTNESCGLHINLSIKNKTIADLDYVKLGVLLGDRYILKKFDREFNEFAVSAINYIRLNAKVMNIKEKYEYNNKLNQFMTLLRKKLNKTVSRNLHSIKTNKYTSIHVHDLVDWRVEFRGPGGNWLDKSMDELWTVVLRCAVALDASLNEKKYQEDYAKKLYKLLDSVKSPKESSLLSQYFAGKISIDTVRETLAAKKSQKQLDSVDENQ